MKKLELIHALYSMAEQCSKLAKALENSAYERDEVKITSVPKSSRSIDYTKFQNWPAASHTQAPIPYDLSNSKIVEFVNGPSQPIGYTYHNSTVDLVCNNYKFGKGDQPDNVRIVSSLDELDESYDIGIIYESLEFCHYPLEILSKLKSKIKPNGKIFVRFRPWASRDGGFQSSYFDKSYAHLLIDLEGSDKVRWKVADSLVAYEIIFMQSQLQIIDKNINSVSPDISIINDIEIMDILIERTWGTMKLFNATRLMAISSVDYLVSV